MQHFTHEPRDASDMKTPAMGLLFGLVALLDAFCFFVIFMRPKRFDFFQEWLSPAIFDGILLLGLVLYAVSVVALAVFALSLKGRLRTLAGPVTLASMLVIAGYVAFCSRQLFLLLTSTDL
jgi:hypothetical protein